MKLQQQQSRGLIIIIIFSVLQWFNHLCFYFYHPSYSDFQTANYPPLSTILRISTTSQQSQFQQ